MENCPKYQSATCVKDGIVQGKQRYRCKGCSYVTLSKSQGWALTKNVKRWSFTWKVWGLGRIGEGVRNFV